MLRARGVPVFSADDEVHRLTAPNGPALHAISRAFPGTVTNGVLDRQAVAKHVFDPKRDPERKNLRRLEGILHPRVRAAELRFLKAARAARKRLVALDIPLLLEKQSAHRFDSVLPAITPYFVMRVGSLPLVPYFRPGDRKLTEAIRDYAAGHRAVLLANHGPIVAGASLSAATAAIEELEETAKLHLLLRGSPVRSLTGTQIRDLEDTFKS